MPLSRRHLLQGLTGAGLSCTALATFLPVLQFLWGPGELSRDVPAGPVEVGPLDQFPIGMGRVVKTPRGPVMVVRRTKKELSAFSARCTHLGCVVRWDEDRSDVRCPCHGARFDGAGAVTEGPATRDLPSWTVSVRQGTVRLETGATS